MGLPAGHRGQYSVMEPIGLRLSYRACLLPPLAIALVVAAAGVADGLPMIAVLCAVLVVLTLVATYADPLLALACCLPLAAMPVADSLLAVTGWAMAGVVAALGLQLWQRGCDPRQQRLQRRRQILEHDCDLLTTHLHRYPELLDACLQLAGARDHDVLAEDLCATVARVLPDCLAAEVHLGDDQHLTRRAGYSSDPAWRFPDHHEQLLYVARELRAYTYSADGCLVICLPLRSDRRSDQRSVAGSQQRRGVVVFAMPVQGVADRLHYDMVEALARLAGLALASVDLLLDARALALHDSLTGLFGQQEFRRRLHESLAQAQRSSADMGLIMCDLDHLKRFNDRHGHATGDKALVAVAKAIRIAAPKSAICCRYGGEEFAIILPEANQRAIGHVAKVIHGYIGSAVIAADADEPLRVTASLGWALARDDDDPDTLLARADAACYRAKELGRDRVEEAP